LESVYRDTVRREAHGVIGEKVQERRLFAPVSWPTPSAVMAGTVVFLDPGLPAWARGVVHVYGLDSDVFLFA
jgi:NADH pyrophosphatase NudC (nudix superfamily)